MFRASWIWIAAMVFATVGASGAAMAADWWAPPDPGDVTLVRDAGEAERLLATLVDERVPRYSEIGPGAGLLEPEVDTPRESTLESQLKRADELCAGSPPFTVTMRGERFNLKLTALQARRSKTLFSGWEQTAAPDGSTYVELAVEVRNLHTSAAFPSRFFGLVSANGRLYTESNGLAKDRLNEVQPDETAAGVVHYRVPDRVAEGPLVVVVAGDLYRAEDAAAALRARDCVRVRPAEAAVIGDSPLIENARRVS